uniref:T-complex protein gamma SU n=1 Tax=Lotharella vacuolata TaxID=74820 RepID=A0A0H5BHN4_9EUKA|nr:T-complex protein gamma SU [Lotharella vacuolata]
MICLFYVIFTYVLKIYIISAFMNIIYLLNIHNYSENNFLIEILKNNYGPLSKFFFMYKLNNHFLISPDTYTLLINLKNTNYIDSLMIIKTIKHYEIFFDGTKYIILFTSFLFEYYTANFKNTNNHTRTNILLTGKLVLKLLVSVLIKFSENIDLKNIFNCGKVIYHISSHFNIFSKKIIEHIIGTLKYKLKILFFYKKKISDIIIETFLTQKNSNIKIFTGIILKHSKTEKIKFLKNPTLITEEFISDILRNNSISDLEDKSISNLKNIEKVENLKLIKIFKNKKINCLITKKKINDFLCYYLSLNKIMILISHKLSDFYRIKTLTYTTKTFIGKAKTITSIFINERHYVLITQFNEFTDKLTILIKSNDFLLAKLLKHQLTRLFCLFRLALTDTRLLFGCGYTELFIFIKLKKVLMHNTFYSDSFNISKIFLWFYLKVNTNNLFFTKIVDYFSKENSHFSFKEFTYDCYMIKWQSIRTIFLLFWDLININLENKLIIDKSFLNHL